MLIYRLVLGITALNLLLLFTMACAGDAPQAQNETAQAAKSTSVPLPTPAASLSLPTPRANTSLTPPDSVSPVRVKIADLESVYKANPLRVKDQYMGKLIEVSGVVNDLDVSLGTRRLYVSIIEDPKDFGAYFSVRAEMEDNETNRNIIKKLANGYEATIVGVIDAFSSYGLGDMFCCRLVVRATSISYRAIRNSTTSP